MTTQIVETDRQDILVAIDLGSSGFRAAVGKVCGYSVTILRELPIRPTGLTEHIRRDPRIRSDKLAELAAYTTETILEAKRDFPTHKIRVIATATQALRSALNARGVSEALAQMTGVDYKIITPREEAAIGFRTVCQSLPKYKPSELVALDIGNGSSQCCLEYEGQLIMALAPIGQGTAQQYLESFYKRNDIDASRAPLTRRGIDFVFDLLLKKIPKAPKGFDEIANSRTVVGFGEKTCASDLAAKALGLSEGDLLYCSDIGGKLFELVELTREQLEERGLPPFIVSGLAILYILMQSWNIVGIMHKHVVGNVPGLLSCGDELAMSPRSPVQISRFVVTPDASRSSLTSPDP